MSINKRDASKYKTLLSYYSDNKEPYEIQGEALFSGVNSEKYINFLFKVERKNRKIKKCLDLITPFRARHTVSAYLLGLTIKDKLQLDTKDWRRLPNEKSSAGSFRLFWSWICVFHDIGYYYETRQSECLNHLTIEGLIEKLNIQHNFLDVSPHADLIRKYYRKRISDSVIDHGIVGALLLYDALIDMSQEGSIYSQIRQHEIFYAKICDTIALHNMWRATNATISIYKEYELDELIPNKDNHHKIYYKDNTLLFLLAVVDSIDPIKFFCRDGRHRTTILSQDIISNFYVGFSHRKSTKKLFLKYKSNFFDDYVSVLSSSDNGIDSWLGVYLSFNQKEGILEISIDTKSQLLLAS